MHEAPERPTRPVNMAFLTQMFAAKAVVKGSVIRRSVASVEREIGREALEEEVKRRGFHLLECGGQYLVVCNHGTMRVIA